MIAPDPDRLLDESGGLPAARPPWQHRDALRITRVRPVVTAPEGLPLVVVRVDTSDDGLFGLGCATFTQRYAAVAAAVREYVAPLVTGRHPADIEDITRLVHHSSYWRGGPVLNNAAAGRVTPIDLGPARRLLGFQARHVTRLELRPLP